MSSKPRRRSLRPRHTGRLLSAIVAASVLALPLAGQAQAEPDEWQWRAAVYAWLPDLEGMTRFPSGADGPTIAVDASQLIDNLDFTFQAALQARKGRWGAFGDLIYLDEGASRSRIREFSVGPGQRPADVELDANLDLESWILTLGAIYNLRDADGGVADVLFGARMLDLEQTLDWQFAGNIGGLDLPGPGGSSTVSGTYWDAVVGLKGQLRLGAGDRWLVPWHVDAGAGDSDFTWQAMAGVGYRFDWGSVMLNYRYLDYDLGSEPGLNDLTLDGPLAGISFDW